MRGIRPPLGDFLFFIKNGVRVSGKVIIIIIPLVAKIARLYPIFTKYWSFSDVQSAPLISTVVLERYLFDMPIL